MLPRFTGRWHSDLGALARSGVVDRAWGAADLALLAVALSLVLVFAGVIRVRRRPLPVWFWLVPACLPLLTSGHGPARFGVAATLLGGCGAAHALMLLGRPRWPRHGWRWLGLAGGFGAFAAWLSWSVGGWAALAIGGLLATALPLAWPRLGPPSRLRVAIPWMANLQAGLLTCQILWYIDTMSSSASLQSPLFGPWWLSLFGLAAIVGLGWRAAGSASEWRAAAFSSLLAIAVVASFAPPWKDSVGVVITAALAPAAPGAAQIANASGPSHLIRGGAPAAMLVQFADRHPGVLVTTSWSTRRSTRFATLQLLSWARGVEPIPLRGTVQEVISRCGDPCVIETPATPRRRVHVALVHGALQRARDLHRAGDLVAFEPLFDWLYRNAEEAGLRYDPDALPFLSLPFRRLGTTWPGPPVGSPDPRDESRRFVVLEASIEQWRELDAAEVIRSLGAAGPLWITSYFPGDPRGESPGVAGVVFDPEFRRTRTRVPVVLGVQDGTVVWVGASTDTVVWPAEQPPATGP